jgi:hypothetical protein
MIMSSVEWTFPPSQHGEKPYANLEGALQSTDDLTQTSDAPFANPRRQHAMHITETIILLGTGSSSIWIVDWQPDCRFAVSFL